MSFVPRRTTTQSLSANSSAPIAVISDDVIQTIFLLVAGMDGSTNADLVSKSTFWPALTHVCRYWRHLALNTARLWTSIYVKRNTAQGKIQAYLDRARTSPLRVIMDGHGDLSISLERTAQMIAARSRYLEALRVSYASAEEMAILLKHFKHEAPILCSLQLDLRTPTSTMDRGHVIFGGHTPMLQSVALTGVSSRSLPPLQGLTTLTLGVQMDISEAHLMPILKNSPQLEDLKISTISPAKGARDNWTSIVELTHLKTFYVFAPQDISLNLIDHVSFPHTTDLHVRFLDTSTYQDTSHYACIDAITSKIIKLTLEVCDGFWESQVEIMMESQNPSCSVTWVCSNIPAENVGIDESSLTFESLDFNMMRLSAVQHLDVAILPRDSWVVEDDWKRILLLMPNIMFIRLDLMGIVYESKTPGALCRSLAGTVTSTICPRLTSFQLVYDDVLEDCTLEEILECFEWRQEHHGYRLASFQLLMDVVGDHCVYSPPLQARLDSIADNVVVEYRYLPPYRVQAQETSDTVQDSS